jgi:hypothetical protein
MLAVRGVDSFEYILNVVFIDIAFLDDFIDMRIQKRGITDNLLIIFCSGILVENRIDLFFNVLPIITFIKRIVCQQ